ncbi:HAMP domain-containing protein [Geobacter sulfurreducens]|jgi:signal transduction histidine kinase|uniref:histidine kinase n=1 Tax=Geobacter sulfurreducens (strain ATCC 51573 / DSM 12127 / PCA) TaxID=243231 RepID=Q74ES8_GEOSL|nr:ATP-binding protein [Geobacter sulfurreducens]AAR34211.1 sensor histidine kinase, HAMP domain-containing [Geobacter sulfurreducens PCA]ADI83724.1 sensor histidine kinase, HAMP domain-containing [Geobacter sulfurreducens KN400]AJY70619.1 histidine kinase [Geobacter sulfurreducens]UAC04937.1 HAMP domain-containing protein [Geobacter sulfurreducens]HCD96781.1 HAMP domain-containing protein [Geobacter sulfurreducens]
MGANAPPVRSFFAVLRTSFRAKLFTVICLSIIALSACFAAFFLYNQYRSLHDKLLTEGRLMTRLLAHNARLPLFAGNTDQLQEVVQGVTGHGTVLETAILDREGHPLAHFVRQNPRNDKSTPTAFSPPGPGVEGRIRDGQDSLEFVEPILTQHSAGNEEDLFFEGGRESSTVIGSVHLVMDERPLHRKVNQLAATALLVTAAALVAVIGALYPVIRGITRPLTHLERGVREIAAGNKEVRVPVESQDELGSLAASFNSMAESLLQRKLAQEESERKIRELNVNLEEMVRRRTAELMAANRELESFNYSASHDLRAPLLRLRGLCQALEEDCGDRLDGELRDYLDRIAEVGVQMERVMSAMSSLFRVQRRELELQPVNLSELVEKVVAAHRATEPQRQVAVSVEPGAAATGDPELLWVALDNLIGNAWKFTSRRADARIEFGSMHQEGELVCFIRDNGAGFNMGYAHKIFEPFHRLHGQDEFPGTGVGLAIVQRIISRHQGRVWLESAEGAGTTCYFTLPESAPA